MLKALRHLMLQEGDPDLFLPVIASTLSSAAASIELENVERLVVWLRLISTRSRQRKVMPGVFFPSMLQLSIRRSWVVKCALRKFSQWYLHRLPRTSSCDPGMEFMRLQTSLFRGVGWKSERCLRLVKSKIVQSEYRIMKNLLLFGLH